LKLILRKQDIRIRLKCTIFWVVTPCSSADVHRRLRGTYRLYIRGWRVSKARRQQEEDGSLDLLLGLPFDPEHGSRTFLRNVSGFGVTTLKILLLIVTAVRTSDPTWFGAETGSWKHRYELSSFIKSKVNFLNTWEIVRFWITMPHGVRSLVVYIFSPLTYSDGRETSDLWDMNYVDV
jgi:hypothetical protein